MNKRVGLSMPEPIQIAFLTGLGQGGAAKQVVETAHLLAARGHRVQIMTYNRHKSFYKVNAEIEIIDLQGQSRILPEPIDKMLAVIRLSRAVRTSAPAVVISYTTMLNVLLGLAGRCLLRQHSALLIGSDRNSVMRYNNSQLWIWICRFFYRGLDGIFSNSRVTWHNLHALLRIPAEKTHYLANLLDTDYFCPSPERPVKANKIWEILVPARITAQKNQKILIPVALELRQKGIGFRFVLAGLHTQPFTSELLAMIQDNHLQESFALLGQQEDIRQLYWHSDLVFMPSLYEGLSNSLIEAMACESLVLCSDIPEFSEHIRDSQNGYLVDINQPAAIGDRIIAILHQERSAADQVRSQARLSVLPYGPQTYYQHFMSMLDQFSQASLTAGHSQSTRKST